MSESLVFSLSFTPLFRRDRLQLGSTSSSWLVVGVLLFGGMVFWVGAVFGSLGGLRFVVVGRFLGSDRHDFCRGWICFTGCQIVRWLGGLLALWVLVFDLGRVGVGFGGCTHSRVGTWHFD